MGISFHFNYSEKGERALPLYNSLGLKKTRLHFHDKYVKDKDRYAVYAKKITLKKDETVPNGLKGRFIYQQIGNSNDYYKINKASLQKRLGINSSDLQSVKDHHYEDLIEMSLFAKIVKKPKTSKKIVSSNPKVSTKPLVKKQDVIEKTSQKEVPKKEVTQPKVNATGPVTPSLKIQGIVEAETPEVALMSIYKDYCNLVKDLNQFYIWSPESKISKFNNAIEGARGKRDPDLFHAIPKNEDVELLTRQKEFQFRAESLEERVNTQSAFIENLDEQSELNKELVKMTLSLKKMSGQLAGLCYYLQEVLIDRDYQSLTEGTSKDASKEELQKMVNSWEIKWENYTDRFRAIRITASNIEQYSLKSSDSFKKLFTT